MLVADLDRLLADVAARRPAALLTALADGRQRLVHRGEDAGGPELTAAVAEAFRTDRSRIVKVGDEDVFINVYNPPLRMILIGAVHISQALIPIARSCGYDITVIDPRTAFATPERFAGVTLIPEWPDDALQRVGLDARTAFVALTHDPKIDDPALHAALASDVFYVGALGSSRTHAKRTERLAAAGIGKPALDRIHAPIGLDIGAIGAAEIALSIMAEVTAVLRGKAGRPS
jgi:xanthine dehydrogenase accessory factor